MPVRKKGAKVTATEAYSEICDISFLPEDYKERIWNTFDKYFNLGLLPQVAYTDDELPAFPNNVATLDSDEVGNYLGKFTAWFAYTADKKKYLTVAQNVVSGELDVIYRKTLATMVTKANLEIKKAEAKSSEEYLIVEEYVQDIENLVQMLDIELGKLDKSIGTLSREISRRERASGI